MLTDSAMAAAKGMLKHLTESGKHIYYGCCSNFNIDLHELSSI